MSWTGYQCLLGELFDFSLLLFLFFLNNLKEVGCEVDHVSSASHNCFLLPFFIRQNIYILVNIYFNIYIYFKILVYRRSKYWKWCSLKEEYDSHYWSELGKFIHSILLSPNSERPFIAKKDQLSETFIPPKANFTAWRENCARSGKWDPWCLCVSLFQLLTLLATYGKSRKQTWSGSRNRENIHSCKMKDRIQNTTLWHLKNYLTLALVFTVFPVCYLILYLISSLCLSGSKL